MLSEQSRTKPAERRKLRTSDSADILPQDKRYENVTIDCIDGNWMRGIPLRCLYIYTIKRQ